MGPHNFFSQSVRVLFPVAGAVVAEHSGDLPPSEGVEHGVEVLGHASSGVHRKCQEDARHRQV
jgi:hypothetical protein